MATLEDIGKRTGCSAATISRILNNSAPVSKETRDVVMREIKRMGYRHRTRRRRAQNVASSPDTIDIIMSWHSPENRLHKGHDHLKLCSEDLSLDQAKKDPFKVGFGFFRHIVDGIVEELAEFKLKAALQVVDTLNKPKVMLDLNRISTRGVLLMGSYDMNPASIVENCTRPLVLIDLVVDSWPDVVTIDNAGGIQQGFQHLRALGHEDIGFVSYALNPAYQEREEAFQVCMISEGLTLREEWFFEGAIDIEHSADGIEKILQRSERPTAFMCACDYAAMGVIRAAGRCGISVPEELSVVGFDDSDVAMLVTPALTTIHVPALQMGRQAVRQLLMCEDVTGDFRQERGCEIRVKTKLVERQSTGPRLKLAMCT